MTQTIALVATALISTAVALGIAYAVFKSTARTNTVELYERENEALTKALARQETEALRLQGKVDALSNANMVLQETVSGTLAIKELAKEIAREESARREEHAVMLSLQKDFIAIMRRERGEIS